MLKSVVKKLLDVIFDKSLPSPTSAELAYLSELKTVFLELSISETTNLLPVEASWLSNANRLRELVLNHDPREFLRWDIISNTMFVSYAQYISMELNYLKHRSDWNTRWRTAIKESWVGHPMPYIFYRASSGNLIHHAYHVAHFEEKTNILIQNMDYVFEFGGGYGSMCRLLYNLGFHGRYVLFDLPSFSALQRYYLRTLGLPVQAVTDFVKSNNGIVCVSDLQQLITLLTHGTEAKSKMFIATWSISESPLSIRETVLNLTSDFHSFLIAYQDRSGDVNNLDFFNHWKETKRKIIWHSWQIEHIPGNYYLVGTVASDL
ncbi:MAG: hypothetical protein ACOY16_03490 [Chloroflexota bacterium]